MQISVVCMKKDCNSDSFTLQTELGECGNTVYVSCSKCKTSRISKEIEKYQKAAIICPKCHCKEYIVKKDNDTDEFSIYCKGCKTPLTYIDVNEKGIKISKEKLRQIKLEERIEDLEDRIRRLESEVEYSLEEKLEYLGNCISRLDNKIDSVEGSVDQLKRQID